MAVGRGGFVEEEVVVARVELVGCWCVHAESGAVEADCLWA